MSESQTPDRAQSPEQENTSAAGDAHRLRNGLIWTAALILLLLGIGLAVPDLRDVLDRVSEASVPWMLIAVALEVGSCLGYVAVVRLVLRRAPKKAVRQLAWAEMAFGAVVPAGGAGGLAVGAWAMRAWGVPWARIANRSAVIFLLTTAVNAAVLVISGFGVAAGLGYAKTSFWWGLLPGLFALTGLLVFVLLPKLVSPERPDEEESRFKAGLRSLSDWVADTEHAAVEFDWRLLGAISYLLLDIGTLWACLRAVGFSPSIFALITGYQIGYLANLVPIPGGLGVLDGGLLGALVLFGLPTEPTAAAVIIYHAIALWVPTLGGTIGFALLRRSVAAGPLPGTSAAEEQDGQSGDPSEDTVSHGPMPHAA